MKMDSYIVAHDRPKPVALARPRRRDNRVAVLLLATVLAAGLAVANRPPLPAHAIAATVA